MKKAYRVKSEKDFETVFFQGKSMANRQFVVYVLPKPNQTHFRVGLSVGKKMGNAVVRNSIKRKIRQSILELEDTIVDEIDFIIIARQPTAAMTQAEIKKSLIHVLNKLQLLKKH